MSNHGDVSLTQPELLPCPFCGGNARMMTYLTSEDSEGAHVECSSCRAKTEATEDAYADTFGAADIWNTRALPLPSTPDDAKAEPVAVKLLDWESTSSGTTWTAVSPVGRYVIHHYPAENVYLWFLEGAYGCNKGAANALDIAKSAAQQDYEQRVRSALVFSAPASDGAIREALDRWQQRRSAPPAPSVEVREKINELRYARDTAELDNLADWLIKLLDDSANLLERLSSGLVAPAQEGWNEAIDAAKEAVQSVRHAGACNFTDARYKGQRGQDHADALYDAYQAISSLHRGAKESDGGTELNLKPGWLAKDVQKASEQVSEWTKPSDPTQETVTR